MNYGKFGTEKKIKSYTSHAKKYVSKFYLYLFKAIFTSICFCLIFAGSVGFGIFKGILDSAPDINMDSIVPSGYATTVYDSAGNLTDTLVMAGSNREAATYEELPTHLINAFVAIEDSRFWTHNGVDTRAIFRAVKGILTGDSAAGGGSTLTQQLIKNNVFNGGRETSFGAKLERKLQEQYLAMQLDSIMDKKLILTNYLNTINLGNNTLGVKVAARRYFDKEVSDLTLSEATVIAGITQNPTHLNPITGQERNAEKRKIILQYMFEQGYITKVEQEEALEDDVYARILNVDSITRETAVPYSYFTDELTQQVKQALMDQLGYTDTQAHNLLYSGGLQIHTTQDPIIQAIVDEEVNNPENYSVVKYSMEYRMSITHGNGETKHYSEDHIKNWHKNTLLQTSYEGLYNSPEAVQADIDAYQAYLLAENDRIIGERLTITLQPQVSFVIMDQITGHVKAINGGRGNKTASLTLNRATNTLRQPGSTFKIITAFAPAIDSCGDTLGTVYYDSVYTVGNKTFSNWFKQGFQGYSSIRDGIIYSMNIVAVRCLMETVTPQLGVEYAEKFGITLTSTDVNAATALGGLTKGVSNLDLTGAYAAIANGGIYQKPIFFTKIIDHNGKVLINNEPETHRVLKDSTAFLLTDAMAASMESNRKFSRSGAGINSTSTRSNIPNMSNAGKSGTTSNNNDIWFVGYTPYYTAGIWAGCDSNQKLTAQNGGTSFHKDIWRKVMTRVHEGLEDPGFAVPASVETAEICRKSGKLAAPGICNRDPRGSAVYTEYFAKGTVPTEVCTNHIVATVCADSGRLVTQHCPSRTSRVFMALPQGEEGSTDDSVFAMPGYCNIHSAFSTIIDPSDGTDSPADPITPEGDSSSPFGPGYISPNTTAPTTPAAPTAPFYGPLEIPN